MEKTERYIFKIRLMVPDDGFDMSGKGHEWHGPTECLNFYVEKGSEL